MRVICILHERYAEWDESE